MVVALMQWSSTAAMGRRYDTAGRAVRDLARAQYGTKHKAKLALCKAQDHRTGPKAQSGQPNVRRVNPRRKIVDRLRQLTLIGLMFMALCFNRALVFQ
jgi:hypothetical protein